MAASRMLQIRRALSVIARNQTHPSLFKEAPAQYLPLAYAFLSRDNSNKRWIQTQTDPATQRKDGLATCESLNNPSPRGNTEGLDAKHKVISNLKINSRHDLMMMFTCKVCETRSVKMACRESYDKGVVVARCPGCENLHLIADRLGWFGEPGSIEDFLAARGEKATTGSMDTLNLTLEDLAGSKVLDK